MIKFFKKHKNISLVLVALVIAVTSGLGGAFIHDEYTYPKLWQRAWDITNRHAARVFDLWDQCHHKKGFYAIEKPQNPNKLHPSHYNLESTHTLHEHEEDHDHKKGACCDACAKNLPCESKSKKTKEMKDELKAIMTTASLTMASPVIGAIAQEAFSRLHELGSFLSADGDICALKETQLTKAQIEECRKTQPATQNNHED